MRPHRRRLLCLGVCALAALAIPAAATPRPIQVAVAANFIGPMQQIAQAFEARTGHEVRLSSGATGRFYAQIRNGAPFDVFLAADQTTPARLVADGLAQADSVQTYAIGRLVLWSAQPGLVDDQGEVLRRGDLRHLAIANPRTAPYGAAAIEVLQRLDLLAAWQPRFVQGENIAQTHQFVSSGNAPLGFVAYSQVVQDGRIATGSGWLVPEALHTPIRQDAVLLTRAAGHEAARALLAFLQSDAARAIARAYGYGP